MNTRSAEWTRETRLRQRFALGASAAVWALGYWITDSVIIPLVVVVPILVMLEFTLVLFSFEVSPEYRAARNRDLAGLVGQRAVVSQECAPAGQVRFAGELWQAVAVDGAAVLRRGQEVVVEGATGLVLRVAKHPITKAAGLRGPESARQPDASSDRLS